MSTTYVQLQAALAALPPHVTPLDLYAFSLIQTYEEINADGQEEGEPAPTVGGTVQSILECNGPRDFAGPVYERVQSLADELGV